MSASEGNKQKEMHKQTAHATDIHVLFVDTEPKFGDVSGVQHMSEARDWIIPYKSVQERSNLPDSS